MAIRSFLRTLFIMAILSVTFLVAGGAASGATDVGRTAADFLMIGHGARAAALGGAYTALASGSAAAYWNPAGLSGLEQTGLSVGHFAWLQDIKVEQVSLGVPLADRFSGALSATCVNYGQIDGYDVDGNAAGALVAYDWVGGLSIGVGLSESFSLGLTGKYVNQRLDDISASAFAADFGVRYQAESFALGATVVNLGSTMTFDKTAEKLPAAMRVGAMFRPFSGALLTSLEVEQRFYGDLYVRQGLELGFSDQYFLRAGYDYLPAQDGRWLATGLSLGAGLRLGMVEADYAFTPNDRSTSEDLHRFTLTFLFGSR